MRARWAKGLDFKIPDARKEPVQYLWFVGDFASFDERVQLASQSVARILHDAGVSFGLLYEGERNAGNDVRRIGEEGLFELLVEQNMSALGERAVRGDLHHRPALAEHAAQRVSGVRPRQAGLPLHRAARRPRRARRHLAADAADGDARHLPRPVLPGALQPDHRGAAHADRGDRRRARRDAAPRDGHVLLRRRRRPDVDEGRSGDRASGRASSGSARRRRSATSTTSSSPARRTWRCTRTRSRSSAPTSRSPS